MRALDRVTIEERGIAGARLMEEAGRAVWTIANESFAPSSVAVVCGKGNNGGDGFVVARLAAEAGRHVAVLLLCAPDDLTGDARHHFDRLPDELRPAAAATAAELDAALAHADLIVDAIFGTGFTSTPRGAAADAIAAINRHAATGIGVLAVDIPSGVPADAGWDGAGPAVRATMTVTIGAPKVGMVVLPGVAHTGALRVARINFPDDLLDADTVRGHLLTDAFVASLLPARAADGHKGTFGSCLIVAGSAGLAGAAILAARGALRSGVGLTHLAVAESLYLGILPAIPEAIVRPLATGRAGVLDGLSLEALASFAAASADVVAIGPGIGRDPSTLDFVVRLCARVATPVVLDADAVAALGAAPELAKERGAPVAITPHPGELARLVGGSAGDVQRDRIGAACGAAARFGCHVLLKGAQTIVAHPGGDYFVNPTGNTGLAKGGSGDVLTGLIAGLAAQGLPLPDALAAGAYLHGLAADLLADRSHPRAMLPSDVADTLADAFRRLDA